MWPAHDGFHAPWPQLLPDQRGLGQDSTGWNQDICLLYLAASSMWLNPGDKMTLCCPDSDRPVHWTMSTKTRAIRCREPHHVFFAARCVPRKNARWLIWAAVCDIKQTEAPFTPNPVSSTLLTYCSGARRALGVPVPALLHRMPPFWQRYSADSLIWPLVFISSYYSSIKMPHWPGCTKCM